MNGLRSKMGAFEFGARMVTYVMYGLLGLGLGFGSGAVAYALAYSQKWQYLPVLFWVLFLMWQVIPVMLASFGSNSIWARCSAFLSASIPSFFSMLCLAFLMCRRSLAAFVAPESGLA